MLYLKYWRERAGANQDELAALSGVAQATISSIESGDTPSPRIATVQALLAALNTRLDPPIGLMHLLAEPAATPSGAAGIADAS